MVEFEKQGIPTVSFTADGFVRDAHRSAENFGLPRLPIANMRLPFTNQAPKTIRAQVDGCIDQVIAGLTVDPPITAPKKEITVIDEDWLDFAGDDLLDAAYNMNRRFIQYGWSDGLVLRPPRERDVERMMSGTKRNAQDVVAILEPGFGIGTVEKIAANAVMAGCEPEHLPVVIAAVELLAEPKMYIRLKGMSTGPHAPLLVVNGPIRERIGLNSGCCALGPGSPSYANTAIGRAVRLCMMNVGHIYPGVSDMDTVGSPDKYSMCVAENEEASPWSPYHVEQGFDAGTSTVTLEFVYGTCELHDFESHEPDRLAELFATAACNAGQVSTACWLVGRRTDPRYGTTEREHHMMFICPEHADTFHQAGWDKNRIRQEMFERARMPFHTLAINKEPKAIAASHPELAWLWDSPDTMLPVLEAPDCYDIAVVGGAAGRGLFMWGAGEPMTKAIEE